MSITATSPAAKTQKEVVCLFTGKERDDESGNDHFLARYYSSMFGRFMTPDWAATPAPIPYAVMGNPQTLNLYSYVQNNPITGTDPDGHTYAESLYAAGVGEHSDAPTIRESSQTMYQVVGLTGRITGTYFSVPAGIFLNSEPRTEESKKTGAVSSMADKRTDVMLCADSVPPCPSQSGYISQMDYSSVPQAENMKELQCQSSRSQEQP